MTERDRTASAFNALSHPRRIAIFDKIEEAGATGIGFDALMGATGLQVSTLRHHLRPMIASGLVMRRRRGLNVRFYLHGADLRLAAEAAQHFNQADRNFCVSSMSRRFKR